MTILVPDDTYINSSFIKTLMFGYLLSLGDYDTDVLDDTTNPILAKITFIVASVFLQVILLNMTIAIMGDTFDRIMDQQQRFKIGVTPDIYSDYFFAISFPERFREKPYLYVINFKDQNLSDEWAGHLKSVKSSLEF